MSTQMHHRGDRLVVPFEGELDWPRATAFVDAVDTHLEHYRKRCDSPTFPIYME